MTEDTASRKNPEILEDVKRREITKETEPTENTGISQAVLVDLTEDTETTEV